MNNSIHQSCQKLNIASFISALNLWQHKDKFPFTVNDEAVKRIIPAVIIGYLEGQKEIVIGLSEEPKISMTLDLVKLNHRLRTVRKALVPKLYNDFGGEEFFPPWFSILDAVLLGLGKLPINKITVRYSDETICPPCYLKYLIFSGFVLALLKVNTKLEDIPYLIGELGEFWLASADLRFNVGKSEVDGTRFLADFTFEGETCKPHGDDYQHVMVEVIPPCSSPGIINGPLGRLSRLARDWLGRFRGLIRKA